MGVDHHRQVGDRVLDLGPLVELRAADHLVADLGPHERVLEHPRLGVGPVEDGDLRSGHSLVHEALDLARDESSLSVLVLELSDLDRIALPEIRPQRLRLLRPVVPDHGVGRIEDRLRRAIVLLELDHPGVRERVLELEDVPDIGPAKAVDRVMRDDPLGNEVVRVLDVEVTDEAIKHNPFYRLDDVVSAVLVEHDHARTN